MNDQNLKRLTSEEARERGRKGGKASVAARKKKKLMIEDAQNILALPIDKGTVKDLKYLKDAKGKNLTVQQVILLAIAKNAMAGNVKAAQFLRDTAGEQVTNNISIDTKEDGKLADILDQLGRGEGNV